MEEGWRENTEDIFSSLHTPSRLPLSFDVLLAHAPPRSFPFRLASRSSHEEEKKNNDGSPATSRSVAPTAEIFLPSASGLLSNLSKKAI